MSGLGNYTSDARDFWKKGMQGGRIGPILDCSQSTASSHKAKLKVYSRRTREGPTKGSIINEGDSSRFFLIMVIIIIQSIIQVLRLNP